MCLFHTQELREKTLSFLIYLSEQQQRLLKEPNFSDPDIWEELQICHLELLDEINRRLFTEDSDK